MSRGFERGDVAETGFFDGLFGATRVMVILRGLTPESAVRRAEEAWDHGVRAVEVTVAEPVHLAALDAVIHAARVRGALVGAGSVYRPAQVAAVAERGVDFTVAPGLDADISRACRAASLPHLPGVASATELTAAERLGHTWVKAFPASVLGPAWFTAMRGPFPWVKWVATGGIDASGAEPFLAAGARAVGMGAPIVDWIGARGLITGSEQPIGARRRGQRMEGRDRG